MTNIARFTLGALALATAGLFGCSTDTKTITVAEADETGTFVQRWTIEGSTDDARCSQYRAERMRVVVHDEEGGLQATEFASCTSHELRLLLRARTYTANATFLDSDGNAVSDTLPIERFSIAVREETTRDVDFSAAAMHNPSP